ncbi:MAG: hypothetical protein IKB32_01785 [Clostridia bacterium]|nr:hypothetical protein [Clostridia bacterium]
MRKTRIFSLIIVTMMILGTMTTTVFAQNDVAEVGGTTYASIYDALAVGGEITLLKDVTASSVITVSKDTVLDLNGFTVTGSAKKTFEVYANATFKNGTIKNVYTSKEGRCIDTRTGGIRLDLEDVELIAKTNYNQQVLNIGGDATDTGNITVNISNSTITASNSGYGIMTFNPVVMTITNTEISGYAALYFKAASGSMGSNGSVVNVVNSDLNSSYRDYENFGTIVFEDTNIDVTVDADSSITTEGNAVLFSNFEGAVSIEDNNIALNGAVTADKVVDGWKEGTTVSSTNSNVIDALKNEGFAVSDGVVEGKIATATDSGFYMMGENKLGLMRYLFSFGIEGTITNAGVKFINGDKLADNIAGEVSGNANTFFADIVEVPENTEGKYYAVGFVTIGEKTYWSNPIFCEPDFTRHFSSLDNGGAK